MLEKKLCNQWMVYIFKKTIDIEQRKNFCVIECICSMYDDIISSLLLLFLE